MTVTSRPIKTTRIAVAAAAVVLVVFVVVAVVMPHANAGASFTWKDQVATGVIGLVLAGFILVLTRPRLFADDSGVHIRNHWGPYKTVPWDVIVAVEFPKGRHFARLVLPADETIPLYAVQRSDREHSVAVMRDLRELLAHAHRA
jgi:membrane protease YdiL (CAAX protease family)